MRKAEELFKRSFGIPSTLLVQEFNKREWPVFLLARGRAQEAVAAANTMAAHRSPVVSAAGHVEAGARAWRWVSSRKPPTKATPH